MPRFFSPIFYNFGLFLCCLSSLQAQSSSKKDASPWGIASGAEWAKEYPKFDPLLHQAGVTWIRYFPEWNGIQPQQGEWKWDYADGFVSTAEENEINIAGVFAFAAKWATTDGGTRRVPLKDIQFWRDYVAGTVTRFQSKVTFWEVWNEFNGSFAAGEKTPATYAELVREASTTAKKIDPNVKIGMSVANFDVGFLDLAIKAGAAGHFDFLAVHPYENLGAVMDGGEMGYLSLAGSLRKMLKSNNQPEDMPLWITEIGKQSTIVPNFEKDALQADALVYAYILSLAQGFDKIFWFEARGPAYGKETDHGIIRADWSLRPVYYALKNMTSLLGGEPRYLGWVDVGGGFGFVFQGTVNPVLVTWARKGKENQSLAPLPNGTKAVDVLGRSLESNGLKLSRSPIYVTNLPNSLVTEAENNKAKAFPWGTSFSETDTAKIILGATDREEGIKQTKPQLTEVVHGLDWSARKSTNLRGRENHYIYFRVDPTFAGFGNNLLEITAVARRVDPNRPAGFAITYESIKGYQSAKGRWEIPAGEEWVERSWIVDDANFVGAWGWNFRADAGGSPGEYQLKEVRVKKLPGSARPTKPAGAGSAAPAGRGPNGVSVGGTASIQLGAQNREEGLALTKADTSEPVEAYGVSARKTNNLKGGEGHYLYFKADPEFVGKGNRTMKITIVARRVNRDRPVALQLNYESESGYKNAGGGRWEIPSGNEWFEHTWTVNDAKFAGAWGWNFRTDAGGSKGECLVKEVRVSKSEQSSQATQ